MSPRQNNTIRLTSEDKKIKPKNKSSEKVLPVLNTLRKSKGEGPKSPRRVFNYSWILLTKFYINIVSIYLFLLLKLCIELVL